MKNYVIIISKKFPKGHRSEGNDTDFEFNILMRDKIHTIRKNHYLWWNRFENIYKHKAQISLREWEDKPYRSKQTLITERNYSEDYISMQTIVFDGKCWRVDGSAVDIQNLAENDGLSLEDFNDWFKDVTPGEEMALIHFTNFRY